MLRGYDTKTALALPASYSPKKGNVISNAPKEIKKLSLVSPKDELEHALGMHPLSRLGSRHDSIEDLISLNIEDLQTPIKEKKLNVNGDNTDFINNERNSFGLSPLAYTNSKSASAKRDRFVAVHMMSEDHKLSLDRERKRITNKNEGIWHSLPSDASAIYLPRYARTAPPSSTANGGAELPFKKDFRGIQNMSPHESIFSPELSSHSADPQSENLKYVHINFEIVFLCI
jgi:hypothetical protein